MMPGNGSKEGRPARRRDDVLANIGEALGRCEEAQDLYSILHSETSRVLDTTGFILGLYDEPVQTVTVVYQADSGVELPGGSFPLGNGFTSQVILSRQPRLIRRWSEEGPRVRIQYATDQKGLPESGITVPLLLGTHVVGVLSVQSYQPEAYDSTDLLKLQVIATQAAVALDRVHNSTGQTGRLPKRVSELETILAGMSEALLIVDAQGCITRLNRAARKLLCPEEGISGVVLGQPLDKEQWGQWPLGPRAVALALGPLVDALRRGETLNDLEIEIHNQGRRVFSFSCAPLHDGSGALAGGVIVFRDVTGKREVERIKDEMLSIASHELKAPITVIKGQAQILQRQIAQGRSTTESIEHGLAAIVHSSNRLVALFDLLLDLSRLEAGRFELRRTPIDLVSLARDVTHRVQGSAPRHQLVLTAPQELPGVWDAQRLDQLFQNLLSNAVKYSPEGSTVEIDLATDGQQVTVSLRDEGVGIEARELPYLFERFYRAEGARRLEGSGLGLYICQGIVSAHGGRIWAESAGLGLGSCFSFTLPLRPADRQADRSMSEEPSRKQGG